MSSDDRPDVMESVKGIEDIVIERRLNTIFDIRREIHDMRKNLEMGMFDESLSQYQVLSGLRTLVTNYLLEIHPLMLEYEDEGHDLLENHEFGEAELNPTVRIDNRGNRLLVRHVRGDIEITEDLPRVSDTVPLNGLYSLMDASNPLEGVVRVSETDRSTMRTKTVPLRYSDQIGMSILTDMIDEMNTFLADIGLELEPEQQDADRVAEYDYSNLI